MRPRQLTRHLGVSFLSLCLSNSTFAAAPVPLQAWAFQTLSTIQAHYTLPSHLYSQQPDSIKPADLWTAGIQLPALNAVAALDSTRIPAAAAYADALDLAWHTNRWGHIAYGPQIPIGNRYYDDNEWVVLALCETYELTHAPRFLDRAQTLMKFIASGESPTLGGGIWWRELGRDSKNTCSNAPAICGALRLYHFNHDPQLLALAHRLYAWTNKHFQDPADGLYFDNMKLNGRVEKTKYSYNTALMLRANCLFYELTQDKKYLREAQRLADAAEKHWFNANGAITDASQFAHLLSESLLDLTDIDHRHERLDKVRGALEFLHDHLRTAWGFYSPRWDRPETTGDHDFSLMYQASALRGYAVAAHFAAQWH